MEWQTLNVSPGLSRHTTGIVSRMAGGSRLAMYKSRLSKCKITGNARTKTDDGSGTSAPVVFSIGDRAISHQETGKFWGQIEN